MAEGKIIRKGGVAVDLTTAPSLTLVSKTSTEIVFTITNNDALTADIFWEADDTTPDANTLSLAAAATSSNQTISGLSPNTEVIIYAFANAAGKAGSQTVTLTVTTDQIIYTAATGGTTQEYDSGGKRYKSHAFNSSGTFTVTTVGDATDDRNKVDFLIIAGGGGGGMFAGGGGGAGGFRTTSGTQGASGTLDPKVVVTAQGYTITVGLGGGAGISGTDSTSGQNTSALGITSTGGGRSPNAGQSPTSANNGANGGSGGGGSYGQAGTTGLGGTGTANQGKNGGDSKHISGVSTSGGGGGGAGQDGGTPADGSSPGGNGGNGLANNLRTGSNETRAGGGAGQGSGSSAVGGTGGGGNASSSGGANGTANTGSGGGGGLFSSNISGAGGSGLVVIRYEIAPTV